MKTHIQSDVMRERERGGESEERREREREREERERRKRRERTTAFGKIELHHRNCSDFVQPECALPGSRATIKFTFSVC